MTAFVFVMLAILFVLPVSAAQLDPTTIPKWVNTITGPPPVYVNVSKNYYEVSVSEFDQQILPSPLPKTHVYGYGGLAKDAVTGQSLGFVRNSPGPTFEAKTDVPIKVKFTNELTQPHMFTIDKTIMWAAPANEEEIPICVHLHGGEVPSTSDGGPDAWWTYTGDHGSQYHTVEPTTAGSAVFEYPNSQEPATLWYHDHALGMTRLNVVGGMAGFYILRDNKDKVAPGLPKGKYEVPLVIQDRVFNDDGTFNFLVDPTNPESHPSWGPEFFGDTIMVNGLVWPKMNVDQAVYRFRILDGSTARFYNLRFSNNMPFTVIGTEGGYLKSAVNVNNILIAPGERFDILVDFSTLASGTEVILMNSASAPFPDGDPVDPLTTGQIMKFVVDGRFGRVNIKVPANLNPTLAGAFPNLPTATTTRSLVLTEVMGEGGPLELLLNGQKYDYATTELPVEGTTEEWIVANPTADTHPIHLHLVQFQVVKRQQYNVDEHYGAWLAANQLANNGEAPPWSGTAVPVDVTSYLTPGTESLPPPTELGWKDTVKMNPGEVTWIRVRFASQDGTPFPFDPKVGYYVWHCHIIDHEDNEMMRPFQVVA